MHLPHILGSWSTAVHLDVIGCKSYYWIMLSALVLDLLLSNAPEAVVPEDDYIHSDNLVALSIRLTLCSRIKIPGLEPPISCPNTISDVRVGDQLTLNYV